MRGLITSLAAGLVCIACPAPAQSLRYGPMEVCDPSCRLTGVEDANPRGRLIRLRQTIEVEARPAGDELPLMVRIVAMASSEVRWNGHLIGRNGVPAERSDGEVPGRFIATILVPPALVRAGANKLDVAMS